MLHSQHCKYYNNVSTIRARTITLSSSLSARRRAPTPVHHPTTLCLFLPIASALPRSSSARRRTTTPTLHPTTICLILSIASTHFLTRFQQSEATSNTATNPPRQILAYVSLLFSMLGALSGALSAGRSRYQELPAFVEGPGRPTSANINHSHVDAFLPDLPFQLPGPRWMIQTSVDAPKCLIMFPTFIASVFGGFAAAAALVALRRLRTSPRFIPWTGHH